MHVNNNWKKRYSDVDSLPVMQNGASNPGIGESAETNRTNELANMTQDETTPGNPLGLNPDENATKSLRRLP